MRRLGPLLLAGVACAAAAAWAAPPPAPSPLPQKGSCPFGYANEGDFCLSSR